MWIVEKSPPKPSPQGGGLNPAALSQIGAEAVPRVLSPLVGEMGGSPEGVFNNATPWGAE